MATRFDPDRKEHSDIAHRAAQKLIYPYVFGEDNLIRFEDTTLDAQDIDVRNKILDGELGIDRIIHVSPTRCSVDLNKPMIVTVQERFRDKSYYTDKNYRDITVTEWNHATNLPSEIHKLAAQLFVYGYFDYDNERFVDSICVNVPSLVLATAKNQIIWKRQGNDKRQTFLTATFDQLHNARVVQWHQERKLTYTLGNIITESHACMNETNERLLLLNNEMKETNKILINMLANREFASPRKFKSNNVVPINKMNNDLFIGLEN